MLGCCKNLVIKNHEDYAVIGLPMTLVVIIIVSSIIFSLYAVGTDHLLMFHQEQQVKECISSVCDHLSIMQAHAHEDSLLTLNLNFPKLVDTIIFGYDSISSLDDSENISFIKRSFITVLYKNGHQSRIHCPFAFSDPDLHPLVFHSGTYKVQFSMRTYKGEVLVHGLMQ